MKACISFLLKEELLLDYSIRQRSDFAMDRTNRTWGNATGIPRFVDFETFFVRNCRTELRFGGWNP